MTAISYVNMSYG